MGIMRHGSFIYYPPCEHQAVFYKPNLLTRDLGNKQQSHSLNLFFEIDHGVSSIAVDAISENHFNLKSLSVKVTFTSFSEDVPGDAALHTYEGSKLLDKFFISLGAAGGKWDALKFTFDSTDANQNKDNQEKAEALFLFLSANVGTQPINFIKEAIHFKDYADPERVRALAAEPKNDPEVSDWVKVVPVAVQKTAPAKRVSHAHKFFNRIKTAVQDCLPIAGLNTGPRLK